MSATVFLICGPVASGKTQALLTRYHDCAAQGIGAALWIAPTLRARDAVRPKLLGAKGVCLAPNLHTFPDFARQIVRAGDPSARWLPEWHQRLLLDEVLAELVRRNELPFFAAVAEHRGFAEAVFSFITELKGQRIGPEEFALGASQVAGNARDKDRQVARIHARYQQRLDEQRLFDRESTYTRARELWTAGQKGPFAAVTTVFVDGFLDFTPPQLTLIEAIVATTDQVWISLVADRNGDDSRNELFAQPLETLARLRQMASRNCFEIHTDAEAHRNPSRPVGLASIEQRLFRPNLEAPPVADATGVSLIEAPGLLGEVRLVARLIKTILLDQADPTEVIVTARDLAPYADLVCEVFAEYGLPFDLDSSTPLTRNPAVSTLLRGARLADDSFPFAATTALLRSSYFRPDWPEVAADPQVVEQAEVLLRLLGEPRGREANERAVRLWASAAQPGLEDEQAEESRRQRKHRLAQRCQAFLEHFFRAWDKMRHQSTLEAHIDWLRQFAADLGIAAEAERMDAHAWARLWSELQSWTAHDRALHERIPTHSRTAFSRLLGSLTASVGIPRSDRRSGCIRVLPAEQVRQLDCDYLFILGLGERSFPDLRGNESLYDDAERQAFRQQGLEVRCASDRMPEEMLLFYQLVTQPRKQLVLSYPAIDAKGQELLPSSFLSAVLTRFSKDAVPVERQRMLIEGFERIRPLSPAEYRVRWVLDGGAAGPATELFEHLRDAGAIARQRFHNRAFTPYDGLLRQSNILADLEDRFGPNRVYSPTALERYVDCPFRFFLEQVLKVETLEDPGEEVEQTRRGAAVHRALARLHQRLKEADAHVPTPELDAEFCRELDKAIEEYAIQVSSPAGQALWRLEGQRLHRSAARYRGHWEAFQSPWREGNLAPTPHLFEVDFGLTPDCTNEPLVIRVAETEVRIGGRIDRIDVTSLADGGLGFWIIDYKTGRSSYYVGNELTSMRRLQMTLYALAAERVLLADARPLGLAYWLVADTGPKLAWPGGRTLQSRLAAANHWPRFRAQLEAWVAQLVGHIRSGSFPLKPRSENCTDTCSFGQVCRIAQSRSIEKDWNLPLPMAVRDE